MQRKIKIKITYVQFLKAEFAQIISSVKVAANNSERKDIPGNTVKGQNRISLISQEASDHENHCSKTANILYQSCQINVNTLSARSFFFPKKFFNFDIRIFF